MCSTERIIHIYITEFRQFFGKTVQQFFVFRSLGFDIFRFVEAGIFANKDFTSFEPVRFCNDGVTNAVIREFDFFAQQFCKVISNRFQAEFRIDFPLRAAEVAQKNQAGTLTKDVLNGRKGSTDTGVVRYFAIFERNVKVYAHYHTFAFDIDITYGLFVDVHDLHCFLFNLFKLHDEKSPEMSD